MPARKEQPKEPERLFAIASPHSLGGVSMFEAGSQIAAHTVGNFYSEEKLIASAVERLRSAGFEILQVSGMTINIAAPIATYEKAFGRKIHPEERAVIKGGAREDTATFWEPAKSELPGLLATKGTAFSDFLEGVAIEEPYYPMQPPLAFPLAKAYWHLDVPAGVSLGCNADQAHRSGITGKGIKVAMADSGWYKHPFFVARGYRAAPVVLAPGAANPLRDESGHGTGESANVFSVAPDVQLLPVKMSFVNTTAAFNTAVGLEPAIITCSWGSSICSGPLSAANQALAAAIAAAVAAGIIVVFSAGNGHAGFPGQHPDVISAGGVYMASDGSLRASDYSSGFVSKVYPNRRVPDLCGLVGMKPKAAYIMLPVEPGCDIDVSLSAGGPHPNSDETANNDGWAAFSGTSAAAPQLAGAAALVKQACPKLTPAGVRSVLMSSARDVTMGHSNSVCGVVQHAAVGPDTATGNGLVDANRAVLLAKIRCLPIVPPIEPIRAPIEPIRTPIEPIREPVVPPIVPVVGPTPIQPIPPAAEADEAAGMGLTAEDIAALEAIVLQSPTAS